MAGLIQDPNTADSYTVVEALQSGVLKITDQRCVLDPLSRGSASSTDYLLFVVEHVYTDSTKSARVSLAEAVERQIVLKPSCQYTLGPNKGIIELRDAWRRGLVEARAYTGLEVKWMLDDFAAKLPKVDNGNDKLAASAPETAHPQPQIEPKVTNETNGGSTEPVVNASIGESVSKIEVGDSVSRPRSSLNGLESFNEFFIYDSDSEKYIPLSEVS